MDEKPDPHKQKNDVAKQESPKEKGRVAAAIGGALAGATGGGYLGLQDLSARAKKSHEQLSTIKRSVHDLAYKTGEEAAAHKEQLLNSVDDSLKPLTEQLASAYENRNPSAVSKIGQQLSTAVMDNQKTWVSRIPGGGYTLTAAAAVGAATAAYGIKRFSQNRKAAKEEAASAMQKETQPTSHVERLQQEQTSGKGHSGGKDR